MRIDVNKSNTIRGKLLEAKKSSMKTYMELTVGNDSIVRFIVYEVLTSLLGPIPGALGFYLRQKSYRLLFKKMGKKSIIGRNVVIRHPNKIEIGDNVTIDDNCVIDARGAGAKGLVLEDYVIINRNCMLQAKAGSIRVGKRSSLGSYSMITSVDGVQIGESVLIAGSCYLNPGVYRSDDLDAPIMDQGAYAKGPLKIGSKSYLRAGAHVVEGVSVGAGVVIGAGAVVENDIPENGIAAGNPARIIGIRKAQERFRGEPRDA